MAKTAKECSHLLIVLRCVLFCGVRYAKRTVRHYTGKVCTHMSGDMADFALILFNTQLEHPFSFS